MKYICKWDEELERFLIELDSPDYDGPVTNVNDDIYVYHVEADGPDEAIEIAELEKAIDDCI
jgi:uncharacterized protein YihD (DUF1040 family)